MNLNYQKKKLNELDFVKKYPKNYNVYNILLQAAIFSNSGASIKSISKSIHQKENTIRKKIKLVPEKYIIFYKESNTHYYKLNKDIL